MPIAVPVKSVGKTTELAIQTKLNALEIPYLESSTKNHIQLKAYCPLNMISREPDSEIHSGPIRAGFKPPNLKISPDVVRPRLSAIEQAIELVKISPGKYLS